MNSIIRKVPEIEKEEIRKVIGIVLYMGIMKFPNRGMYWNTRCNSELTSAAISRNNFDKIMKVLYFNDNNEIRPRDDPLYNKCHKIQPLINHFHIVFKNTVLPETFMSVDEQVVQFKGVHSANVTYPKNLRNGVTSYGEELGHPVTYTISKFMVVWYQKEPQ